MMNTSRLTNTIPLMDSCIDKDIGHMKTKKKVVAGSKLHNILKDLRWFNN